MAKAKKKKGFTLAELREAYLPEAKSRGGAREGAGRKSAEELGIEKKKGYSVYMYPTQAEKLIKKYGSLLAALESLL